MSKRHRLRVVKAKAEELEMSGESYVCPRCTKKHLMVPIKARRTGKWVHLGDVCPECGFEYSLKDAPN